MDFSGYLLTVASSAALGIIADIFTDTFSQGKKGIDKYIKFGITLCIVSCMLFPLIGLFGNGDVASFVPDISGSFAENASYSDGLYILERECEEKLSEKIYMETGIKVLSIRIEMKTEDNTPKIDSAEIILCAADGDKIRVVEEMAYKAIGTKADVTVSET